MIIICVPNGRQIICKSVLAGLLAVASVAAAFADESETAPDSRQFTYSWPFSDDDAMRPRGGTTKGPPVKLDRQAGHGWQALQEPGLSALERDRRAILAMAGGYRTSFDFIETIGFIDDYEPARPYQSWGTEFVYVVADEPHFISLQHVIVMFVEMDDGEIGGPFVVKHWRQDWRYQDTDLHVHVGHNSWERRLFSAEEVRGAWSQSVFQVDDSPRYAAIGRWLHDANYSSWTSDTTWRPLPRREYSVRDDYHVLSGTNRHTITPTGWIHEEDNLKVVLDANGNAIEESPYLAREAGLNRYERIVDHDFSAGDEYWTATAPFWRDVRDAWDEVFDDRDRLTLKSSYEDRQLFEIMFEYAAALSDGGAYDPDAGRKFIDETMARFLD